MTCDRIPLEGGGVMWICDRSKRPKRCSYRGCTDFAERECDGPTFTKAGKVGKRLCNAAICQNHATPIGDDLDLCPGCAAMAGRAAILRQLVTGPRTVEAGSRHWPSALVCIAQGLCERADCGQKHTLTLTDAGRAFLATTKALHAVPDR